MTKRTKDGDKPTLSRSATIAECTRIVTVVEMDENEQLVKIQRVCGGKPPTKDVTLGRIKFRKCEECFEIVKWRKLKVGE